ncbi:hypothetical protein FACS189426_15980 [Bacteroidia bacterium]|nr:hypothetical protein FACS189426_15980 [Bacteroidia bacterium]
MIEISNKFKMFYMIFSIKLLIVAGPNGSGKTSVTGKILKHEWVEGWSRVTQRVLEGGHDVPIQKIISRYYKSIANCAYLAPLVDRLYVYDNSVDNAFAELLFRVNDGMLVKRYTK